MKKVLYSLILGIFLSFGAASFNTNLAQDEGVSDSISIDDQDPILYVEEEEEDEKSSTGIYIAVAIAAVAAGVLIARVIKKKK